MKLEQLNETEVEFGGVFDSTYEFKNWREESETANVMYVLLNGLVYEFKEDPSDGYRSHCDDAGPVERPKGAKFSLEHAPIKLFARYGTLVSRDKYSSREFEGLRLFKSKNDEKCVAEFGTDNADDYYPSYTTYVNVAALKG